MEERENKIKLDELVILAMDCLEVGVTIFDPQGTLLYYNNYSTKVLDRKPEYIGTDIHRHHKKPTTNEKFDLMLQKFSWRGGQSRFIMRPSLMGRLFS